MENNNIDYINNDSYEYEINPELEMIIFSAVIFIFELYGL